MEHAWGGANKASRIPLMGQEQCAILARNRMTERVITNTWRYNYLILQSGSEFFKTY